MSWQSNRKRRLLADLAGTVLEIGAGRGANFGYLPSGVRWLGLEPHRRRRASLIAAASRHGRGAEVLAAPAEAIPLPDASCDAVVSTIVLCSVRDQDAALAEVRRVLRPGGRFVFLEHVAAPRGTWTRRLQRCWAPVSRRVDSGCDPARDTAAAIERSGFAWRELELFEQPFAFGLSVPFIAGRAFTAS
ncbi:class I SAM-dependent methyltransferase [Stackebrandtia nassauensis]|uniref:Methyltransferase type 11 n=1 Tax=Stackebrandtia nassauensis (strain DSM 44728 / CIP 108903 / NRRL B-16338 / NBRC 102104 / LLR-40K-21) TaxID=446470 RepID=D3Q0M1_STANL|nr:class I SAM-dependent methyltransferase [Stackebrandtia nassauensis]ADD41757.1 Methyltransferase type 11 [Stackebrandtia nassauensis DSM 44728]